MSNPARAPREPLTARQLELSQVPQCNLPNGRWPEPLQSYYEAGSYKKLGVLQEMLSSLDMEVAPAIMIPGGQTCERAAHGPGKEMFAMAQHGAIQARVRSEFAMEVLRRAVSALPEKELGDRSARVVMEDKLLALGGTEFTLGRLRFAYPKRGAAGPGRPPTRAEAEQALRSCGLYMADLSIDERLAYPLIAAEGDDRAISVNPKSDNGFPVGRTWAEPAAREMAMGFAVAIRSELVQVFNRDRSQHRRDAIREWKEEAEQSRPQFVALKGKCKSDYYSLEKLGDIKMRFYNAFPRHIMLNMQMATQPLERYSRNILQDWQLHTGIGVSLVRGGAQDLVDQLDRQLMEVGTAYVHVGDDSWVVVRVGEDVVMFALDCSNFDLTQHADSTAHIHDVLHEQLALFDGAAAALWHAFMRKRMVVLTRTIVRHMRHAGPSGAPLQSKVNDMLMDVALQRVAAQGADTYSTQERTDAALRSIGNQLGLKIRVEQYVRVRGADSVAHALESAPFLFIGYYFHVSMTEEYKTVTVCCDVARTFAQTAYPGLKWVKAVADRGPSFRATEAMRLGSIALNLGIPAVGYEMAFAEFRCAAVKLVREVLAEEGNLRSDLLRWAVAENPFAAETAPNLQGLLRALEREPENLWVGEEFLAGPGTPRYAYGGLDSPEQAQSSSSMQVETWADEVEADERGRQAERPAAQHVRAIPIPNPPPPTHPATTANDGRPPPTVTWGPNKPPRETREVTVTARRRRGGRGALVVGEELEEFLADAAYSDLDSPGYSASSQYAETEYSEY
jgi:hypothetical protein